MKLNFCAVFIAASAFFLAGCGDGLGDEKYLDFDKTTGTITGYTGAYKTVTIPPTIDGIRVTAIGRNAFKGKQLKSVTILANLTTIGEGAFAENQLSSITLPNTLINIGVSAFHDNLLTTLTIPNGVVIIGQSAFALNQQLAVIVIPNSVTSIGGGAFSGDPLTSVTIGAAKDYASNIVPNFGTFYNDNNKLAGTYTRPNVNAAWVRQ